MTHAIANDVSETRRRFRAQMPIAERLVYFNHAAVAPLSGPASEAIGRWLDEATHEGNAAWGRWDRTADQARLSAAQLIGAGTEEIAFVSNTTAGISLVAEGFSWSPGDNVVTLADEFPSNQYPWLNLQSRGVEVRRLPTRLGRIELQTIADACDARTRIVAISWVNYATGYRHDVAAVAEIAHRRGGLVMVDAIQGLGVFPLDVADGPIDFLAADGHKWLLAPEGAGILYIRREHLERIRPQGVGWHSVVHEGDFARIDLDLKAAAERFEGGSPNSVGITGLGASLAMIHELDPANIGAAVLDLTQWTVERLKQLGAKVASPDDAAHRSGIVSFDLPGQDVQEIRRRCLAAGIIVSVRNGRLRISPHGYNNEGDIERLLDVLKS
jgi:selenocysteine lyase/cysteine desulfurase